MDIVGVQGHVSALQASTAMLPLGRGGQNWVVTVARLYVPWLPGQSVSSRTKGVRE